MVVALLSPASKVSSVSFLRPPRKSALLIGSGSVRIGLCQGGQPELLHIEQHTVVSLALKLKDVVSEISSRV